MYYVRTKAVGATVTGPQPCTLALPCLLIDITPRLTYCSDHTGEIMSFLTTLSNHYGLHLPAAFDLELGEAVVTVFLVETTSAEIEKWEWKYK